jgi:hypothetical protein
MRDPRSWGTSHAATLMIVCFMVIAAASGVSAAAIEGSQSRSTSPDRYVWATIGTATATTRPVAATPTLSPQVAVGPRLNPPPTATPTPSGPGSYVNYLAVWINQAPDKCQAGSGLRAYPGLFAANTYPDPLYALRLDARITNSNQFYVSVSEGYELHSGRVVNVDINPIPATPVGPLHIIIQSVQYPYSDLYGYWEGTVQPCY